MTRPLPVALALALVEIACTRWQPTKPATQAHSDMKPYTKLQGVIASLPSQTEPRMVVCHGAMPKIGPTGDEETSIPALVPFWLGENAKIDALKFKEGDRIQFDLEVDWDTEKPVLITAIKKLDERNKLGLNCP